MKNRFIQKVVLTTTLIVFLLNVSFSQIKVDQSNSVVVGKMPVNGIIEAHESAKFEITLEQGEKLGFLKPRMIEADMLLIQNPAHGLEIFNITQNTTYYWDSEFWVPYLGASYEGPITFLEAGENITITGNGTENNAYVITSSAGAEIYIEGINGVIVTGSGTVEDPFLVDASNAIVNWSNITNIPPDFADGEDAGTGHGLVKTNGLERYSFVDGYGGLKGTFDEGPGIDLEKEGVILKISSNDLDGDPTNEIETWQTLGGIPSDFADDEDAGTNVEIQPNFGGPDEHYSFIDQYGNFFGSLLEGDGVNLEIDGNFVKVSSEELDGDPTNEYQNLNLSENTGILGIDFGNTVDLNFLRNDPNAWSINGNDNTAFKKLGTLDEQPLRFITNVYERMRIDEEGRVGIGTVDPISDVHIEGNIVTNITELNGSPGTTLSIGYAAGTSGYNNNIIGDWAGYNNTTGGFNEFMGRFAGNDNTTGSNNQFIGYFAGALNTTGNLNVYIGSGSGGDNETGDENIAIGNGAIIKSAESSQNIVIGRSAVASAQNNVILGANAGNSFMGNFNTMLGSSTSSTVGSMENSTALGYSVLLDASNIVRVGNAVITSIGGFRGWTDFSDSRFKQNVTENVPGMAFIAQLRPVTYNFDATEFNDYIGIDPDDRNYEAEANKKEILQTGFLAQEVEAAALSLNYKFSGVDEPNTPQGYYGLRYAEFVVPLVKATQEQQQMIDDNKAATHDNNGMIEDLLDVIEDQQLTISTNKDDIQALKDLILDLTKRVEILEHE